MRMKAVYAMIILTTSINILIGCNDDSKETAVSKVSEITAALEGKTETESEKESKRNKESIGQESKEVKENTKKAFVSAEDFTVESSSKSQTGSENPEADTTAASSKASLSAEAPSTKEASPQLPTTAALTTAAPTTVSPTQSSELTYGNSGMAFDTLEEADAWADAYLMSLSFEEFSGIHGYRAWTMENGQWTIDFY